MRTITRPGKFEGEACIAPALYEQCLDGGASEECGDQETLGWYAWKLDDIDFSSESPSWLDEHDLTYADCIDANEDTIGAIILENSDGFVTVRLFDKASGLHFAWEQLCEESGHGS